MPEIAAALLRRRCAEGTSSPIFPKRNSGAMSGAIFQRRLRGAITGPSRTRTNPQNFALWRSIRIATDQRDLSLSGKEESPGTVMVPGLFGGSKGIRTPDPLHAMQVRYRAAPWTPVSPQARRQLP